MKKVTFLKKVSLFRFWSKTIKSKKEDLMEKFNTRIDGSNRLYTVINLPAELIEEHYNLRKSDIDTLARNYITEYSTNISSYLNSFNLMELYEYYEVKKVAKYSYLVVFGFSLFKSHIFLRNLYIWLFSLSLISLIFLLILIF
jgi:hypothetical protein